MARLIRSYPPEYRRWILEQLAGTTESLAAFSARSGIPASTLSAWRFAERQHRASQPDADPIQPEAARDNPFNPEIAELEQEVMRMRAEGERQRIAYAHQALELAEALVEIFCLRHGMDPAQILSSRPANATSALWATRR